jgi:hypothetical protein
MGRNLSNFQFSLFEVPLKHTLFGPTAPEEFSEVFEAIATGFGGFDMACKGIIQQPYGGQTLERQMGIPLTGA